MENKITKHLNNNNASIHNFLLDKSLETNTFVKKLEDKGLTENTNFLELKKSTDFLSQPEGQKVSILEFLGIEIVEGHLLVIDMDKTGTFVKDVISKLDVDFKDIITSKEFLSGALTFIGSGLLYGSVVKNYSTSLNDITTTDVFKNLPEEAQAKLLSDIQKNIRVFNKTGAVLLTIILSGLTYSIKNGIKNNNSGSKIFPLIEGNKDINTSILGIGIFNKIPR